MTALANLTVLFVAFLHLGFMVLEMFLWTKPIGKKVHGFDADLAHRTRKLAANQGLYNGFLAAGLIWSLISDKFAVNLQLFFLGCVILAGIYGGLTTARVIFWVQALPGTIALVLVFLAQSTY